MWVSDDAGNAAAGDRRVEHADGTGGAQSGADLDDEPALDVDVAQSTADFGTADFGLSAQNPSNTATTVESLIWRRSSPDRHWRPDLTTKFGGPLPALLRRPVIARHYASLRHIQPP